MKIIYYMPMFLKEQNKRKPSEKLSNFCELFKIVGANACIIDRTYTMEIPFETFSIFNIPDVTLFSPSYEELCLKRARELLESFENITVLYSGGIDSTVVLLSFYQMIQQGIGHQQQITVAATPHSIIENPEFYYKYILPNFNLVSSINALGCIDAGKIVADRYVSGENADHLFGSGMTLTNFDLFHKEISDDNIEYLMDRHAINASSKPYILRNLNNLRDACPLKIEKMSDLLWWINFSCHWQSDAIGTLCYTNFLNRNDSLTGINKYESFFNTEEFQVAALYGNLQKWGDPPAKENYKVSARAFVEQYSNLPLYRNKIKVPSLYRLLASSNHVYHALGLENGMIYEIDDITIFQ